jgi:hypothetical protein
MDNYEKNIENIKERLDEILGFSQLGHGLKSFVKGAFGDTYSDVDKNKSGAELGRDYGEYLDYAASEEEAKAMAGKPSMYKIGDNYAKFVEDELIGYLSFRVDQEESKIQGTLVHTSDKNRVIKLRPSLEWLYKGVWKAKRLGLTSRKQDGEGAIKGRLVTFDGVWESGDFMGVLKGGEIIGGQIKDGYYLSRADGFKISPWDFKSGGFSVGSGFVFGMPLAKDNTKYKSLSIFQVPTDKIIKIIDNNDQEYLLNVNRGVSYKTVDMKIDNVEVSWSPYSNSKSDFEKSFIKIGEKFDLPGVLSIDKGVQSIEVKTLEYEGQTPESQEPESQEPESQRPESWNRFDVKTSMRGWTPGTKGGYFIDIDESDDELIDSIQKFKEDINSGKFFRYLDFFKALMDEGRIDGYGNYPSLAFLFPKQIGTTYKANDEERDRVMKYFSEFRQKVVNKFRSQNITKHYLNMLKKYVNQESKPKVKSVKKTKKGSRPLEESKLSILKILRETL